jgi:hypothetical protein
VAWQNSDETFQLGAFARIARVARRYPKTDLIIGDIMLAAGQFRYVARGLANRLAINCHHQWTVNFSIRNQALMGYRTIYRPIQAIDLSARRPEIQMCFRNPPARFCSHLKLSF